MSEHWAGISEQVGWAILQSLWQGAIVGLIAILLSWLIREASIRHLVNLCGMITIGFLFAFSFVSERENFAGGLDPFSASFSAPSSDQMQSDSIVDTEGADEFLRVPDNAVPLVTTPSSVRRIDELKREQSWISFLFYAWVTGVFCQVLRHTYGYLEIHRLRRTGMIEPPRELISMAQQIAGRLKLHRDAAIFLSTEVVSPLLTGVVKPLVLIPVSAVNGLSREELSAILAHELAHIRRRDHWTNGLQVILETLLCYHPVVWFLGRRVRQDRELAADDLALKSGTGREALAHALAAVAELPELKQVVGSTTGSLLNRISRLASMDRHSGRSFPSRIASSGLTFLLVGALVASMLFSPVIGQSEKLISVGVEESIQEAIDSAEAGTIIQLEEGIYPGRIKLNKPLTIRGASWEKTSLIPSMEDDGDYTPTIELLKARGVVFENVRISPHENPATGGGTIARDYAVLVGEGASASFSQCAVVGPGSNGILVTEGSKLEMEECLVAAFWGTGIVIGGKGDDYVPSQLHLARSAVRSCRHRGVTLSTGCDKSVIEHCWISGSAYHGIRYDNASPRIERNVIFDNARSGIYASGRTAATVTRNLFARNGMSGISGWFLNQDRVVGNIFVGNLREALAVIGASQPFVQDNLFFDEDYAVICGGASGGGEFSESAGPPVLTNNLLVNVREPLQVKGESAPLPESNAIRESLPEVLPPNLGPAEGEEELAAYLSDQGPIAFLELNPWKILLPEENRFWRPAQTSKNEAKSKEPSSREIHEMRAEIQPWIDDAFQLEEMAVREQAIELIREALQSEEESELRKGLLAFNQLHAIRFDALSFHGFIIPLLEHPEIFIRDSAVKALGVCGLQEGDLDRLVGMIDDPSDNVRKSVAWRIISGLDKDLTGEEGRAILTLLDDPSSSFRKSIMGSMWGAKLSPELETRIIELSRENTDSYNALYYALSTQANKSRNSVERLIEFLPDIDTVNVGHRAAWGLGQGVSESEYTLVAEAAIDLVEARQGDLYRDGIDLLKKYAQVGQKPELERLLGLPGIDEEFEKNLTEILEKIEGGEEL